MNILHISTADLRHGAGIAAFRLHSALKKAGHISHMLVAEKTSTDTDVVSLIPEKQPKVLRQLQNVIELGINTFGPQNVFSFFAKDLENHPLIKQADIIHCHNLHWPFKNFPLDFLNIGRTKPLVWTLHDMWPLTGHCFYSQECEKWKTGCKGGCPQLFTFIPLAWDSCPMQWRIKNKIYHETKFSVITPSIWLTILAQQSPMLSGHKAVVVPNIVDTEIFKVSDKLQLRRTYDFAEKDRLLLFVAGDINVVVKGLKTLLQSLIDIQESNPNIVLLVAGKGDLPSQYKKRIRHRHFGKIADPKKLAELYNLAHITTAPSIAETFGNVVAESMSCGTPVIGSRVGGIPDMIDHKINGYLFEPGNVAALTQGLQYFLSDEKARLNAGEQARIKIENKFSEKSIVTAHLQIYEKQLHWIKKNKEPQSII